uniref:Alternative protein CSF2RB n=1 Tax=Homo sapiens TaxID=9606 RepID=L8EC56_HUMAN|nr:alternative protein CSF2RB [Homo sapiens]
MNMNASVMSNRSLVNSFFTFTVRFTKVLPLQSSVCPNLYIVFLVHFVFPTFHVKF